MGDAAALVCTPLGERVKRLQAGCNLVKVADGTFTRNRYASKHVQLDQEAQQLVWEGKKALDLNQVMRISVGLETKTLQKLYTGAEPPPYRPYHWFSLHTAGRSYDFGVAGCGADESETLLLWVLTLQQLLHQIEAPATAVPAACAALCHAQQQWQHYASSAKEWACIACTFLNPGGGAACATCGAPRPSVTLLPVLMPLLPTLQALGNAIDVRAFEGHEDSHLQWFLLQAQPPWIRAHPCSLPSPQSYLACVSGGRSAATVPLRVGDTLQPRDGRHVLPRSGQALRRRHLHPRPPPPQRPPTLCKRPEGSHDDGWRQRLPGARPLRISPRRVRRILWWRGAAGHLGCVPLRPPWRW